MPTAASAPIKVMSRRFLAARLKDTLVGVQSARVPPATQGDVADG